MAPQPGQVCETCGAPAAVVVTDLVEIEPTVDEGGGRWARYRRGPERAFCAAHRRPGQFITRKES